MRYLYRFFAVIGFLVVLISALGWASVLFQWNAPKLPDNIVLQADLTDPLSENQSGSAIDYFMNGEQPTLRDLVRALDRARHDDRVKGMVLRIDTEMPLAQIQELRAAIESFRKTGKFVYAFSSSFGEMEPGNRSYYLASGCDQVWLQPVGMLDLAVPSAESPFARDLLDRFGVTPEFAKRKEYKTAFDEFTEKGFTPANQEMMQSLLGNIEDQLILGIASGRKLSPEKVRDLLRNGPYSGIQALADKLIDRVGYGDQMIKEAKDKAGPKSETVDWMDYLGAPLTRQIKDTLPKPAPLKSAVALIYGVGEINQGESATSKMSGDQTMGADTIADAFDQAINDKHIKVIIFRIDSPGGSPVASETIRRAILRAKENKKQVIVSMGALAGSGGYWIATDADKIIADPATLTGSIGVLAGKFAVQDALAKLSVNWGSVAADNGPQPVGNLWSSVEKYDPAARAKLDQMTDLMYADFIARVAKGRNLDPAKVESIARGRVWTGAQAVKIGLVDELGGLDTAFARARETLKLSADTPLPVVILPAPPSTAERISELLHFLMSARMPHLSAMLGNVPVIGAWLKPLIGLLANPAAQTAHMPLVGY